MFRFFKFVFTEYINSYILDICKRLIQQIVFVFLRQALLVNYFSFSTQIMEVFQIIYNFSADDGVNDYSANNHPRPSPIEKRVLRALFVVVDTCSTNCGRLECLLSVFSRSFSVVSFYVQTCSCLFFCVQHSQNLHVVEFTCLIKLWHSGWPGFVRICCSFTRAYQLVSVTVFILLCIRMLPDRFLLMRARERHELMGFLFESYIVSKWVFCLSVCLDFCFIFQ